MRQSRIPGNTRGTGREQRDDRVVPVQDAATLRTKFFDHRQYHVVDSWRTRPPYDKHAIGRKDSQAVAAPHRLTAIPQPPQAIEPSLPDTPGDAAIHNLDSDRIVERQADGHAVDLRMHERSFDRTDKIQAHGLVVRLRYHGLCVFQAVTFNAGKSRCLSRGHGARTAQHALRTTLRRRSLASTSPGHRASRPGPCRLWAARRSSPQCRPGRAGRRNRQSGPSCSAPPCRWSP